MARQKYAISIIVLMVVALGLAVIRLHGSQSDSSVPQPAAQRTSTAKKPVTKLITNEFAYYNPASSQAVKSSEWEMTSGSLFRVNDDYWTGILDSCNPDPKSDKCTNSNVFRLNTKKKYSGNVSVSFSLKQLNDIRNQNCESNDTCWHGTHVWLRYQSEFNLYYVSVNRADGKVVIKRKVPCGNDNSGTYFAISPYQPHSFAANTWNSYKTSIENQNDGSVIIKLYDTSQSSTVPIVTGIDKGGTNPKWSSTCDTPGKYSSSSYPPITDTGSVGVRGDYANFYFKDFTVTQQ